MTNRQTFCVLLFATFLASFSSCNLLYDDIEIVEVRKTKITKITPTYADIVLIVKLNNPNSFPVTVKESDLLVDIDGQLVGKAVIESEFIVLEDTAKFYQISLKTEFTDEFSKGLTKFVDRAMRERIVAHVQGSLTGEVYFLSKKEQIDITQEISF